MPSRFLSVVCLVTANPSSSNTPWIITT
uniref:Uncharacterized protein n=1 Tax=Lepeophtheirus salmonis TaxID=72036 RepID=A0A0K2V5Z4_LEPSM